MAELLESSQFDNILENIKLESQTVASRYAAKGAKLKGKNFIDIDNFLKVLYSLLQSNNYLLGPDDDSDPNKFIFTEEYPNIEAEQKNIVTFEIYKRAPARLSKDSEPFSGTAHYRPLYLGEETDGHEGGRVVHLQSMYDNLIRFKCWSNKVEHARKLATLMESILNKYYYVLRQYVPVMVYQGRSDGRVTNNYGDSRFQGIPLDLFVRTNERVILREQEINCIQTQIQVRGSI
jgi:hypothetical protein